MNQEDFKFKPEETALLPEEEKEYKINPLLDWALNLTDADFSSMLNGYQRDTIETISRSIDNLLKYGRDDKEIMKKIQILGKEKLGKAANNYTADELVSRLCTLYLQEIQTGVKSTIREIESEPGGEIKQYRLEDLKSRLLGSYLGEKFIHLVRYGFDSFLREHLRRGNLNEDDLKNIYASKEFAPIHPINDIDLVCRINVSSKTGRPALNVIKIIGDPEFPLHKVELVTPFSYQKPHGSYSTSFAPQVLKVLKLSPRIRLVSLWRFTKISGREDDVFRNLQIMLGNSNVTKIQLGINERLQNQLPPYPPLSSAADKQLFFEWFGLKNSKGELIKIEPVFHK